MAFAAQFFDNLKMTQLVVRRLLIDLKAPVKRHWCGNDPFLTAWFNALSMSFPVGEQFFIDSVRRGFKALSPGQQETFKAEMQAFVGQEATHRHIHALFNEQIAKHGLVNAWEPSVRRQLRQIEGIGPRHELAITAAYEHFTALFAEWLLMHPAVLEGCEPRLKTLWLWHSAEECEHRSTAFDLYQALGGNHAWRYRWMVRITLVFLSQAVRQTAINLHRDGTLWHWRTWHSGWRHLMGPQGLLRCCYKPWKAYFQAGFHPGQHASELAQRWLQDNRDQYTRLA